MKIVHEIEKFKQSLKGESQDAGFILSNKNESFAWIGKSPESRYQGVFFSVGGKVFRTIESFDSSQNFFLIKNKMWCVERFSDENYELFFMPDDLNCFCYESQKSFEVVLDFKEIYSHDYSEYSLEVLDNCAVVKIRYGGENYYLAMSFDGEFEELNRWSHRFYDYDKKRNSFPFERSVFYSFRIFSKKTVFFLSKSKEEALLMSKKVFSKFESLKEEKKRRIEGLFRKIENSEISLPYNSCLVSLDNLSSSKGVFAGLPWFFQYWSRDELISLKAIYGFDRNLARAVLLKWIKYLNFGWTNFPAKYKTDGSLEGLSIDAVGWLLKRLELFPKIKEDFKKDLESFYLNLDDSFIDVSTNSWMDSIERKKPIEIQAMKLYALRQARNFLGERSYFVFEKKLKDKILVKYLKEGFLYDSEDCKVRPNVFIVYYFCPSLLRRDEWENVFDRVLKELWLDWGGLSTISLRDPLFHGNYTGEISGSYHNGDSWFWINNLAGLVLADLNFEKYSKYVRKIIEASSKEILFMNAIGNHAELSSASSLKSEGAPAQAFSAAMYLELIDKILEKA